MKENDLEVLLDLLNKLNSEQLLYLQGELPEMIDYALKREKAIEASRKRELNNK